ncbi:MAG: hypothetical protein IPH78_04775 [Bacteroidetes bacterium]|nr:hypothetical protein [Bacteroidota bacterium]
MPTALHSGTSFTSNIIFQPSGYVYNNITYNVEKDTLIPPYHYQKIYSSSGTYSPSFLRKDSIENVYVIPPNRNKEYHIYDFSKVAGDTFSINDAEFPAAPDLSVKVDSVNYILLGGTLRKRMYVTLQNWSPDIWIEGIGSLYSNFLTPGIQWDWLDGPGRKLLCFFESETRLYHNESYPDTCFYNPAVVSISELDKFRDLILMPVSSKVCLLSGPTLESETVYFQAIDLAGKIIYHQSISEQAACIDLSHLVAGLYMYSIHNAAGRFKTGRLLLR